MKILIVDDEPNWIKFCQDTLGNTTIDPLFGYDLAIVNAGLLDSFSSLKPFIVATNTPSAKEAVKAYCRDARDYFTKDFRPEKLLEVVSQFQF